MPLAKLYFAETISPRIKGPWFIETDRDNNSRAAMIDLIRTREIDVIKVIEIDEGAGTVCDVTDELMAEAMDLREAA